MFIPLKDYNPTRRFPIVTIIFIALNMVIFFYQVASPEGLQYHVFRAGAVPYEITHFTSLTEVPRLFPPLTLLTSMFLHGGLFHLLGNMLYLWIFGNNIEDYLGSVRFVFFYVICGLGASLTHILFHPNSKIPMIGASGAIAGILGAYLVLFPNARVKTLVFIWIVPVPAFFLLIIWFFGQVMNIGMSGGVAWFAHIGGFLIGLFIIAYYKQKYTAPPQQWVH
jgi:membrane associated rhomboid family serine protease